MQVKPRDMMANRDPRHGQTLIVAAIFCMAAQPVAGQARPEALDRTGEYVGEWVSEARSAPDGRAFRFGYSLQWFDPAHTMVEMLITQRFEGGETQTLWKGFKGWNRVDGGVYYHGFSPAGRAAGGEVTFESGALLTTYDGWGPQGPPVRIQDRFLAIEGEAFTSITSMWRDGAWQEIMRDRWTRVSR